MAFNGFIAFILVSLLLVVKLRINKHHKLFNIVKRTNVVKAICKRKPTIVLFFIKICSMTPKRDEQKVGNSICSI